MEKNTYKTKHLAESAVLILREIKLVEIEKTNKICWFIFENKEKCEEISNDFFFGNLLVNARDYYEVLTRLKNRIFAI
ncbi:hypothetical protein HY439_03635 [Candidatus Microgenomates bacterium]|nr:hypothetical protein [Candidatus Microgenomates bacterium]